MTKKPWVRPALVVGLILAMAAPIAGVGAADHLDSPAAGDLQTDINDLYAFESPVQGHTVLALTVAPAAGLIAGTDFADKGVAGYQIRVDRDGDTIEDLTYQFDFTTRDDGSQLVQVRMVEGRKATALNPRGRVVAVGTVGETLELRTGGKVFTGLRSDPFFFDLAAFSNVVEGGNLTDGRQFNDAARSDFFAELNTLAIVLEVPTSSLGGEIAVWATTTAPNEAGVWQQADRIGRPAINTVVNSSGAVVGADPGNKALFNASHPKDDAQFTSPAKDALRILSSLSAEGSYDEATLEALAGILLPDVLTYDTSQPASYLNGRALTDDVIDISLSIVTGGAITTDGIGTHTDYLAEFPYLGVPNE